MEKGPQLEGITNSSYVGNLHYHLPPSGSSPIDVNKPPQKAEILENKESLQTKAAELLENSACSRQNKFMQRKGIRPASDPVRSNLSLFFDKLKIDSSSKKSNETSKIGDFRSVDALPKNSSSQEVNKVESWKQSYVKPNRKPEISFRFSKTLAPPSQSSNFTPLMYRRAVSLRGPSSKKNKDQMMPTNSTTAVVKPNLRRSNSEKGDRVRKCMHACNERSS